MDGLFNFEKPSFLGFPWQKVIPAFCPRTTLDCGSCSSSHETPAHMKKMFDLIFSTLRTPLLKKSCSALSTLNLNNFD